MSELGCKMRFIIKREGNFPILRNGAMIIYGGLVASMVHWVIDVMKLEKIVLKTLYIGPVHRVGFEVIAKKASLKLRGNPSMNFTKGLLAQTLNLKSIICFFVNQYPHHQLSKFLY